MGELDGNVMVYRNRRLGCWSVLRRGRVVARVQNIVLEEVAFVVRVSGRARACRLGQRNVHAFACGRLTACHEIPVHAVPVRYSPYGPATFTLNDGTPVDGAQRVYFVSTGAYLESPRFPSRATMPQGMAQAGMNSNELDVSA